jgi:signal transduction histidine kinase
LLSALKVPILGRKLPLALGIQMGWARRAFLSAALLVCAIVSAAAAEPKRVLVLHSFGNFEPEDAFGDYFRGDLPGKSPYPIEQFEVTLEIARFNEGERDEVFVEYLKALFAGHPPDLVVSMAAPAARFARRHRLDLFPSTPVLFADVDARALGDEALAASEAIVPISLDRSAIIENILQTLPSTTTIAMVMGAAPIERFWVRELRQEVQPLESRIHFIFLNELSFGDMLSRAAALPSRSAIYFGDFIVDGQGIPHQQDEVLTRLQAMANAPIFGQYDYQLGRGILGGPLLSIRSLSQRTAEVAARILQGATPGDLKTQSQTLDKPEYDWRELRRWGIAEANLPPNSTVRFREPTLWEQYRWYIILVAAFSGLEGILIVALLLNRRRLRRAQAELQASEERMSLAAVAAKLRFWVWDIPRDQVRASTSDWNSGNWYSAEPMKFDQFIEIAHPGDHALLRHAAQSALKGDGEYRAEYRVVLPDSTIRWISGRGRVEFDHNGKPKQLRAVSIDITEQRSAEYEARDLNGRLITAHEDERARLAHALHDDITQRLALVAIEAGRKESSIGDAATKQVLRSMRNILTQLSDDVHALSYSLHPAILQDLGLIEALKTECDRFRSLEAIAVSFRAEELLDEPPRPVALGLYRIAQEALRNVARHASASAIEVGLRVVDGGLQLSVRDNGVGFDPVRKKARPSLGHASMRQRASLVGGELRVESEPGYGTTVKAWVP